MAATQVRFQIECDAEKVLLVLDRSQDYVIMDWQSARILGDTMMQAVAHLSLHLKPASVETGKREIAQVKLASEKGYVVLKFDWTDRLKFTSLLAFAALAQAIQVAAQDMELLKEGTAISYGPSGLIEGVKRA